MRARDPGAPWPGRGYLLPAGRRDQLRSLLGQIAEVTGRDDLWNPSVIVDYAAAHDVLAAGWELTLGALGTLGTLGAEGRPASTGGSQGSALDNLIDLMRTLKAFDDAIRDERLHQRDAALARVREALAALRRIDATAALVNEAAVAVCSLGFDRAIVSRIDHGRWLPETVYVGRDARWAEEILAAGRENPVVLDDTVPEWEMVRRGTALLVSDAQGDTGVNRPIAESSLSRSYVAAPIVAHGSVVGFLHADCYYQKRNLDETDREVLAAFGEGLGYALARSAVLDRLGAVRLDLGNLVNGVSTAMPVADWSLHRTVDPPTDPLASNAHAFLATFLARGEDVEAALTRREVEVLRRMAEGDTNARIARRLVISEGTVKTHVKHILRKLGASNRAEAVSRWVQLERQQRIPGD